MENNKKPFFLIRLLNFLTVPLVIIIAILSISYSVNNDFRKRSCDTSTYLKKFVPEQLNFESKILLIFGAWFHLALYLGFTTVLVMFNRIFFSQSALKRDNTDNILITALNRVIQNTIEQSFIFLTVLSIWVFKFANTTDNYAFGITFITLFLLGRGLFLIGYIIQAATGIFLLRSTGITINLFTTFVFIAPFFNFDLAGLIGTTIKL